ncbi:Adhesin yadA precursor [Serratia fonticola]|nr:Adhesin yadA precursor [Serratia fonticola]
MIEKGTKYFHANSTGADSSATGMDAIAIGMGAVANIAHSVALGDGAQTAAAIGTAGTTINKTDYAFAGTAPVGTVSVGSVGNERTLTNVAAGRLSATSTDAINGSQLFATNSAIKDVTTDVDGLNDRTLKYDWTDTNGDGKVDPSEVNYGQASLAGVKSTDGGVTNGTKITNLAQGDISDLSTDAINGSQLNTVIEKGTKYFHANSTGADSSATGMDAIAIGMGAVANIAHSVALGDGAQTAAAIGTAGTTINKTDYAFAGTAPVGTVSVGSVGNERTLTNVAAGRLSATSTDAINGSQLFATNSAIEDVTTDVDGLNDRTLKYDWTDTNGDGKVDPSEVNYGQASLAGVKSTDGGVTNGTKITNLAQGDVSKGSTDAINGSQLFGIAGNTTNNYTYENGVGIRYARTNEAGLPEADAYAQGQGSTAVGYQARATGNNSLALGNGAMASHDGSVALGAGSVADGSTLGNAAYLVGGTATGEVNIGGRRITGVSAGAMDDDAVNVAQLKAVSSNATEANERALKYDFNDNNGNGIFDAGDTVNYGSAHLGGAVSTDGGRTGGTKIANLARGDVSANSTDAINGSQLFGIAGDITNNYITKNGTGVLYVRTNDTGLAKADAHASGQASTAVGYNATSTGIGSIAMGQNALSSATNAIAIGKDAVASTASSVALGDGAKTADAVATTNMVIRGDSYAVAGNAPVGTVSIGDAGQERTLTNVAAGRVTANSTDAVNGSQLYATVTAINNISTDIKDLGDAAVKYDKNADGTINYNHVTLAGGPTTISNLAAGTQDSDAVNYSQLKDVSNKVTNISNGTDGMFQVNNTSNNPKPSVTGKDATAGGAGAVASGDNSLAIGTKSKATANNSVALGANSVADRDNSVSVGTVGGERQIANVAAGTKGTDAVNVSQLNAGINNAYNYTDNKFDSLKNMVDDNKHKMSAGIAGAMAMSSLPQPYSPGASMVSLGGGTFQDETAVALGASMISDNGKWVTKVAGTTNSQGDMGASVGVGYQW